MRRSAFDDAPGASAEQQEAVVRTSRRSGSQTSFPDAEFHFGCFMLFQTRASLCASLEQAFHETWESQELCGNAAVWPFGQHAGNCRASGIGVDVHGNTHALTQALT